jgi:hypothetical protein
VIIYCADLMSSSTGLFDHKLCNTEKRVEVFFLTPIFFGLEVYHNFKQTCFVNLYLKKLRHKGIVHIH